MGQRSFCNWFLKLGAKMNTTFMVVGNEELRNMDIIRDSAEHHFMMMLDDLRATAQQWRVLHFPLSKSMKHKDIVANLSKIPSVLKLLGQKNKEFITALAGAGDILSECHIYEFCDQDVIVLAKTVNDDEKTIISRLYKKMTKFLPENTAKHDVLGSEIYSYQRLVDQKLLSAKKFEAYEAMSDIHKAGSIDLRRRRRDSACVMFVEDDRFTAAYAANILNRDFDTVICRNGEEAISAYIENAPDIVFLDIHLPGMDGLDVLQAIRAVDPEAYVVMLSVDTARDKIVQAQEDGAEKFMKKPFSKERLINTVRMSPFVKMSIQRAQIHNP